MAGNVKFDSCSASPEELAYVGNYTNGERGSYTGVGLGRSGSLCEGGESCVFASTMSSQGSATSSRDLPPLSEWLTLDPIRLGDWKYTRLWELRRAWGIPFGSSLEDCNFGAAHSKPLPLAAIEELKQFKATVRDASIKARGRAKKFDDSIQKLTKYSKALNSKKQQRSDMLTNETAGGSNFVKTGIRFIDTSWLKERRTSLTMLF